MLTLMTLQILDMEEDKDNQYQLANVSPTSVVPGSAYNLPDGWVVEEVPRRSGSYADKVAFYFPATHGLVVLCFRILVTIFDLSSKHILCLIK